MHLVCIVSYSEIYLIIFTINHDMIYFSYLCFSGEEDMRGIVPRACEEILKAMDSRRGN